MAIRLQFDASGVMGWCDGVLRSELSGLTARLVELRDEICDRDVRISSGQLDSPPELSPLDGGFFSLPQQQLLSYYTSREESDIGRLLSFTKRLMTEVDRIVVVGPATLLSGPRALMDACCQPFFNELSRGQRGSRPRVIFAGDDFDNDRLQGLLYLLTGHRNQAAQDVESRWGIVLLSTTEPNAEMCFAYNHLLQALRASCGGDEELVSQRFVQVRMPGAVKVEAAGCDLPVMPKVGERYTILSPTALAPAALLGVNIMKLQEGALAMNEHFRETKVADNVVLEAAAIQHLISKYNTRQAIVSWDLSLAACASWVASLQSQWSPGRSLDVFNGLCDLPRQMTATSASDDPQYLQLLATEAPRFDVLPFQACGRGEDVPVDDQIPAQRSLSKYEAWLQERSSPYTRVVLPSTDEFSMGQLLQFFMLASVVGARLAGKNPYGQPALDQFRGKISETFAEPSN